MTHDELKELLIEYHHSLKDVRSEGGESRYLQAHHRLRVAAAALSEEDAQEVRRVVDLP